MKDNDRQKFFELLLTTMAYYESLGKNNPFSSDDDKSIEGLLNLWFSDLRQFTIEEVAHGLTKHRRDPNWGHRPPTVADVVKHIRGDGETQAARALTEMVESIQRYGAYRSVVFADPITSKVLADMGGWVWVCTNLDVWMEKDFLERYKGYVDTGVQNSPALLKGIIEMQGGRAEKPALIGSDAECRKRLTAASTETKSREAFLKRLKRETEGERRKTG